MITFDEAKHLYRDGRGQLVPGVTFMLRCVGACPPVRPYIRKALARGRAVHKAIELFLRGTLDLGTVDERIMPWFDAFLGWYEVYQKAFLRVKPEVVLAGSGDRYAGKADMVGLDETAARYAVIDWKTGEEEPWHPIQNTLYCLAQTAMRHKGAVPRVVYLRPDRTWRMVEPADPGAVTRQALSVLEVFDLGRKRHMEWLGRKELMEEDSF